MGFGYERIAAVNPSVVVFSSCLPGQTSTMELPGYGNLASAVFGFHHTTRWPDRPAAGGPFGAYTDTVSPRFGLAAVLAALDHRRRTGEGQYLDLSQGEASLQFLSPGLLDVEVNGHEFESLGNGDPALAPHGVYPVAGDDRVGGGGGPGRSGLGGPGFPAGPSRSGRPHHGRAPGPAGRTRRPGGGLDRPPGG